MEKGNENYKLKKSSFSKTLIKWIFLNSVFTDTNYGNKLVCDQIDTPYAEVCFINILITHPV